jgi:hypothetical protein
MQRPAKPNTKSSERNRPSIHPLSGVLGVVQPRVDNRGSLSSTVIEMANARMALALRNDPPEALQLALLQAYRRHRPRAH